MVQIKLWSIWLQGNAVEANAEIQQHAAQLEPHYLISAVFIIVVIVTVAGIAIAVQKHRQS